MKTLHSCRVLVHLVEQCFQSMCESRWLTVERLLSPRLDLCAKFLCGKGPFGVNVALGWHDLSQVYWFTDKLWTLTGHLKVLQKLTIIYNNEIIYSAALCLAEKRCFKLHCCDCHTEVQRNLLVCVEVPIFNYLKNKVNCLILVPVYELWTYAFICRKYQTVGEDDDDICILADQCSVFSNKRTQREKKTFE